MRKRRPRICADGHGSNRVPFVKALGCAEFTSCEVVRYAKLARVVRRGMNRREFLQSTAATAVAAGVVRGLPVEAQGATTHAAEPWPENGTLIPDEGWRLWLDPNAEWKQDAIFLPEDVMQDADGVVRG